MSSRNREEETPFVEANAFLAALQGDTEETNRHLDGCNETELREIRRACERLERAAGFLLRAKEDLATRRPSWG